jgi:hypothetical protein
MKKSIPYRVTAVRNNDLVHDSDIDREWALNLILAALVDPSFAGSAENKPPLRNDDIAILVADRVSDSVIVRIIEIYEGDYEVSAQSLLQLCRDRVGEKVIEAILLKQLNSTAPEPRDPVNSICCELIDYL